jgi:hypothetical protein
MKKFRQNSIKRQLISAFTPISRSAERRRSRPIWPFLWKKLGLRKRFAMISTGNFWYKQEEKYISRRFSQQHKLLAGLRKLAAAVN